MAEARWNPKATLFARLKLLSISLGTRAVLFSTMIYLSGGIIGTFHHLYFSGTWISAYKWPVYFFVAVAFWNFVGAGLFGFVINPPVSLYYFQGLNLTPVHGHTALFGVYGMLGLGLELFCLRALRPGLKWRDRPLSIAFCVSTVGWH